MLVMLTAKYPASSIKRSIEVYGSPETPKRSDAGRAVSTFVHGDLNGYTTYAVFDVEDKHVAEFVTAQAERTLHMETRIPGLSVQVVLGESLENAMNMAMKQLPR
jgi:hypothetical protein